MIMSNISATKSYVVNLSQALKQTAKQSIEQLEKISTRISQKAEAATDVGLARIQGSNASNEVLAEYRNKIDTFV
jgi:ribosomal protein L18E